MDNKFKNKKYIFTDTDVMILRKRYNLYQLSKKQRAINFWLLLVN